MKHHDNNRILIVDDSPSIHNDFRKILAAEDVPEQLNDFLTDLFPEHAAENDRRKNPAPIAFQLAHADQGEQAYALVADAEERNEPFALAFVDVRMPPGWDGIQTISRIWGDFPNMEMVVCTAYSDYSWEKIIQELGTSDQLQFLRKPFDVVSVKQMALALTTKWNLARRARQYTEDLEREVAARTQQLEAKISELKNAMLEITQLRGILPMCVYCHKIRDDSDYWQNVDNYIRTHTLAEVSHGICPECQAKIVQPMLDAEAAAANRGNDK